MNIQWLSTGSEFLDHARKFQSDVEAPAFEGMWATIDFQPDLFSPQRFSIGVIVAPLSGAIAFRLISETTKLQCVYGRKIAAQFDEFLKSAEFTLARAITSATPFDEIEFDSDNLELSAPWPTSGTAQDAVLTRLFRDVIPLEPSEDPLEPGFVSLDTPQVRQLVGNELKRIAGLAYEQIVIDPRQTLVIDDALGSHQLDFNLRTASGAGSVVSAMYKTPNSVELNLLRADRDLRTYGGIRKLQDLAVFVMAPKPGQLERPDFGRLSDLIDETAWRLERGGLRVTVFDEPEPIARSILEWAKL